MSVIVHLVPAAEWPGIEAAGEYRPATLETGDYLQCAAPERTVSVAEALFSGRDDLLAVCLDVDRLDAPVGYEHESESGNQSADADGSDAADASDETDESASGSTADDFPRVYGPLNPGAVVAVVPFPPDEDGGFSLPDELRELG